MNCFSLNISLVTEDEIDTLRNRWTVLSGGEESVDIQALDGTSYSADPFCRQVSSTGCVHERTPPFFASQLWKKQMFSNVQSVTFEHFCSTALKWQNSSLDEVLCGT